MDNPKCGDKITITDLNNQPATITAIITRFNNTQYEALFYVNHTPHYLYLHPCQFKTCLK